MILFILSSQYISKDENQTMLMEGVLLPKENWMSKLIANGTKEIETAAPEEPKKDKKSNMANDISKMLTRAAAAAGGLLGDSHSEK
jgi:hypothetical protein